MSTQADDQDGSTSDNLKELVVSNSEKKLALCTIQKHLEWWNDGIGDKIAHAIGKLSKGEQNALRYHYLMGLEPQEIAENKWPADLDTTLTKIQEAEDNLEAMLDKYGDLDPHDRLAKADSDDPEGKFQAPFVSDMLEYHALFYRMSAVKHSGLMNEDRMEWRK